MFAVRPGAYTRRVGQHKVLHFGRHRLNMLAGLVGFSLTYKLTPGKYFHLSLMLEVRPGAYIQSRTQ
jgi:hypothetical protein